MGDPGGALVRSGVASDVARRAEGSDGMEKIRASTCSEEGVTGGRDESFWWFVHKKPNGE